MQGTYVLHAVCIYMEGLLVTGLIGIKCIDLVKHAIVVEEDTRPYDQGNLSSPRCLAYMNR